MRKRTWGDVAAEWSMFFAGYLLVRFLAWFPWLPLSDHDLIASLFGLTVMWQFRHENNLQGEGK